MVLLEVSKKLSTSFLDQPQVRTASKYRKQRRESMEGKELVKLHGRTFRVSMTLHTFRMVNLKNTYHYISLCRAPTVKYSYFICVSESPQTGC
jgi:hypothetical protein